MQNRCLSSPTGVVVAEQHLDLMRAFEHASQCLDLAQTYVCINVPRATVLPPRALREAPAQKGRAPGCALPRVRETEEELRCGRLESLLLGECETMPS